MGIDHIQVDTITLNCLISTLLTFSRTTAVLFDEKTSDAKYKNRVAYVVAHELAHQWFGNLVSANNLQESFPHPTIYVSGILTGAL